MQRRVKESCCMSSTWSRRIARAGAELLLAPSLATSLLGASGARAASGTVHPHAIHADSHITKKSAHAHAIRRHGAARPARPARVAPRALPHQAVVDPAGVVTNCSTAGYFAPTG